MKLHRIVSIPLSWIWALILWTRHFLYNKGILKSYEPLVPTIVVGNLSFGGTGKTPHVIWLCELFGERRVAVLSRGHGRKTRGFLEVSENSTVEQVGDEPLFMSKVQPQARFFVCEDRRSGIERILQLLPDTELIILDDAFQHRAVRSPMNMVLTTQSSPFKRDCLVPCGTLRDLPSRSSNAQVLVLSKCESELDIQAWHKTLNVAEGQQLVFSKMVYGKPYELQKANIRNTATVSRSAAIVAISGIANAKPFNEHVKDNHEHVQISEFEDHHDFSERDISASLSKISNFAQEEKWFVTTEKDAVRLLPFLDMIHEAHVKVAVLPIRVGFLHGQKNLEELLKQYVG